MCGTIPGNVGEPLRQWHLPAVLHWGDCMRNRVAASFYFLSPLLFLIAATCFGQLIPTHESVASSSLPGLTDVVTYHFDIARTGWYRYETTLRPSNVNSTTFGKLGFLVVDGKVDGQPLYLN